MRNLRRSATAAGLLVLGAVARAGDAPPAEPELTDAQQAIELEAGSDFRHGNYIAALPLYERLAREQPQSALFAERHAWCLLVKFENLPTGAERTATVEAARQEGNRARALGDHSDLINMLFERVGQPSVTENKTEARMAAAEAAYARGEHDKALAGYLEIAASEPQNYQAHLFAGDAYFAKHEWEQAGIWFQKAIDIDPNVETAYRYWGDALARSGQTEDAFGKYLDGILADPYTGRSYNGLKQWAQANGATLKGPDVSGPVIVSTRNPGSQGQSITMTPDAAKPGSAEGTALVMALVSGKNSVTFEGGRTTESPEVIAAWLAYRKNRSEWQSTRFAERCPGERTYRHSLAEEAESLTLAYRSLTADGPPVGTPDPSVADLLRLGQDGLIEAYVLFGAADAGIAHDYRAYRDAHRDELRRYLATYLVHRAPP